MRCDICGQPICSGDLVVLTALHAEEQPDHFNVCMAKCWEVLKCFLGGK